jgi:hypothetical protein
MEASLFDMAVTPGLRPVTGQPPERGVDRIVGMPRPW